MVVAAVGGFGNKASLTDTRNPLRAHEPGHAFSPVAMAIFAQFLFNARRAVAAFVFLMDSDDLLQDQGVLRLTRAGRRALPGGKGGAAHFKSGAELGDGMAGAHFLDALVAFCGGWEKMPSVF